MLAGQLAQLKRPASDRIEDTTDDTSLPAVAVNNTQTDFDGGTVQHLTCADRVEVEREEVVVYDDGITTNRVPERQEMVSEVVADVTGTGLLLAERTNGSDQFAFPFNLLAAQTGGTPTQYAVDTEAFAESLSERDDTDLRDTWMVGAEDRVEDGVSIDYNGNADPRDAGKASVGLGFTLSWNDVIGEGVVYSSGYIAVYTSWTAAVLVEFVNDAVLPYAYQPDDDTGEQQTF